MQFIRQHYRRNLELGKTRLHRYYTKQGYKHVFIKERGKRDIDDQYILDVWADRPDYARKPIVKEFNKLVESTKMSSRQICLKINVRPQTFCQYTTGFVQDERRYVKLMDKIKELVSKEVTISKLSSIEVDQFLLPIGKGGIV